ncbi:hypothetical protein B0H10DRAFT_2038779 [Mycena sp. CBHHK59/15]|nr:hypothetical protein B0H10DRAFT_2038779 [Mycena sp. CBHHK59/15]
MLPHFGVHLLTAVSCALISAMVIRAGLSAVLGNPVSALHATWTTVATTGCLALQVLCSLDSHLGFLHPRLGAVCDAPWCPSRHPVKRSAALEHAHNRHRNFALLAGGAKIIYEMTSSSHGLSNWCRARRWLTTGAATCDYYFMLPNEVIRGGDPEPGECWTFQGSVGYITIDLTESANIAHISIYNVPRHLLNSLDAYKAPRNMSLWGLMPRDAFTRMEEKDRAQRVFADPGEFSASRLLPLPHTISSGDRLVRLAQFEYDLEGGFQLFSSAPGTGFKVVILNISSNWGSSLTSIYRVGIHGAAMFDM